MLRIEIGLEKLFPIYSIERKIILIKKMMQYFLFIMYNIFCNILFIGKEGYDDVEYKSRN